MFFAEEEGSRQELTNVPPCVRKLMLPSLSKMVTEICSLDCWRRRASIHPAGPAPMMAILKVMALVRAQNLFERRSLDM